MKAFEAETPADYEAEASRREFAALISGSVGTLIVGVTGAMALAWLMGTVGNPGEPQFSELVASAVESVRLPTGVDAATVSLSLAGFVLTLVLAVSVAESRSGRASPAALMRAAWLARVAFFLALGVCAAQVWLCAASVATSLVPGRSEWDGAAASALSAIVTCTLSPLTVTRHDLMLSRSTESRRHAQLIKLSGGAEGSPSALRVFPWKAAIVAVVLMLAARILATEVLSSSPARAHIALITLAGSVGTPWFVGRGGWMLAAAPVLRASRGTGDLWVDRVIGFFMGGIISVCGAAAVAFGLGRTEMETLTIFLVLVVLDAFACGGVWRLPRMRAHLEAVSEAITLAARKRAERRLQTLSLRVRAWGEEEFKSVSLSPGRSRGYAAPARVGGRARRDGRKPMRRS